MNIKYPVLIASMLVAGAVAAHDDGWFYKAFGQSTDSNFSSNVQPDKVGMNQVRLSEHGTPLAAGVAYGLPASFIIESRGGKLANSHDGMTVFYKAIPVDRAFLLQAEVTVEQFGPETGKTPNGQEGVGLFVRDSLGSQRLEPQPTGHEEFPHAANMLLNGVLTQHKANDGLVNMVSVLRTGVLHPWGNSGIAIVRQPYQQGVQLAQNRFRLQLERNSAGYTVAWYGQDGKLHAQQQVPDLPGLLTSQEPKQAYLGFFASRNAKVRFDHASLTMGAQIDSQPLAAAPVAAQPPAKLEVASAATSSQLSYLLQLRPNYAGAVAFGEQQLTVNAGQYVQWPLVLAEGNNQLKVRFTPSEGPQAGKTIEQIVKVNRQPAQVVNAREIHVAVDGLASNQGTASSPVDLATALTQLVPGGTIMLADGRYQGFELPAELSGLPGEPKRMVAKHRHQAVFINTTSVLNASFWQLDGLVFDGNPDGSTSSNQPAFLRVAGSHNLLNRLVARNNADTGIWISANGVYTQPSLWPAYNRVLNSDSYNNRDDSAINADGFAAKLGVGEGNRFEGCVAHNNADDGWDLFNKIEDGPNQAVTIVHSIAYQNGLPTGHPAARGSIGNGFKLGGEGQPAAHYVANSIALQNNMDGFTDNFNTGSITLSGNIALDNARYNYILRNNPYQAKSSRVVFVDNMSIHHQQQGMYQDYFGRQVSKQYSPAFTKANVKAREMAVVNKLSKLDHFDRDQDGNLIMPL